VSTINNPEVLRLEHLPVWEAIPWVVNGRATAPQQRLVANHVAQCEDCRAELELQRQLHAALACPPAIDTGTPARPDGAATPEAAEEAEIEAGLQRLLARLDDAPEVQPLPRDAATPPARRLTLALAAAVVVQAIGLGVLGLRQAAEPAYRTLSESPSAASTATLRVLPDSGMTLAEWQAMLQALGLQVVQGPNAAGAYGLAPAPGVPARSPSDQVARLRATPGIRLAERIGPGT
jgi:hypothetical protein